MPRVTVVKVSVAGAALALAPGLAWAQAPAEAERYVYGPHMGWPGDGWSVMFFGPLFMILLLALLIAAVVLAVRWAGGPWPGPAAQHHPPGPSPLDVLKARFARGEIDKDEYDERRRVLGG